MKLRFKEREVVVGAAALATVIALPRIGFAVPALGPLSSPVVSILIGFALAGMVADGGTAGAAIEGIGYGFIARGAMSF